MRRLVLTLLLAHTLRADARYKLAYRVQANALIQIVAGIAGLGKMNSEGEEVLLKGSRLMVKGEKSTVLLNYGNGQMVLIDHTDKTFERLRIEDMRKRIEDDIPGPLIGGLKRMFPGGGSGIANEVKTVSVGDAGRMPSLEAFRSKHGLSYLLPAMESLVSLMPSVEKSMGDVRAKGELVEALRIHIGSGGKVVNGLVEIREYRESPVEEAELLPPQGYSEVK